VEVAHENGLPTVDVQAIFPAFKLSFAICCAKFNEQVAHFANVMVVGVAHNHPQRCKIAFPGDHIRICAR